ncbi:MAG: cell wall hydrolase [bacterium]|nr:cell wall hydrolase [bacterium]
MKIGIRAIVAASLVITSNASLMITPAQQRITSNEGQAAIVATAPAYIATKPATINTVATNTSTINATSIKTVAAKKTTTKQVPSKYKIKLKTSGNVNLRKYGNTNCKILQVVKKGTVVYAQKTGARFVQVYVNGKTGYISAKYLTKNGKAISYKNSTVKKTTSKTTTKTTKAKNRWGITLTAAEKKLLAQITYLEAGDQSDVGEQAVIVVIFNRMKNSYFKGSLTHVLSARGQFTTWKYRNRAKPTSREYKNIETVLSGKSKANNWKYLYFNMGHGKFKYGDHYFS